MVCRHFVATAKKTVITNHILRSIWWWFQFCFTFNTNGFSIFLFKVQRSKKIIFLSFVCVTEVMPVDHDQYYGFTKFAMELNECETSLKSLLPPTDTRLRPDQRWEVKWGSSCRHSPLSWNTYCSRWKCFDVNMKNVFLSLCQTAGGRKGGGCREGETEDWRDAERKKESHRREQHDTPAALLQVDFFNTKIQ